MVNSLFVIVFFDELQYSEILTELFGIHRKEGQENIDIGTIMLEHVCENVRNYKLLKRGRTLSSFLSEYCLDVEQQRQSQIASSREFSKPYGVFLPTHGNLIGMSNFNCNDATHSSRQFLSKHHSIQSTGDTASFIKFAYSVALLAGEMREWSRSRANKAPLQICMAVLTCQDST